MDAELLHELVCVGEHIHQVRYRRPLIAANISDAGLEQRLRYRENAFAVEELALSLAELLNLGIERALGHRSAFDESQNPQGAHGHDLDFQWGSDTHGDGRGRKSGRR